jgi:hypothetical protein
MERAFVLPKERSHTFSMKHILFLLRAIQKLSPELDVSMLLSSIASSSGISTISRTALADDSRIEQILSVSFAQMRPRADCCATDS